MRAARPVTQVTQLPTSLPYMKIRSDLGPCVRGRSFCHLRHSVARGPVRCDSRRCSRTVLQGLRSRTALQDCAREQRVRPACIQAVACGCPQPHAHASKHAPSRRVSFSGNLTAIIRLPTRWARCRFCRADVGVLASDARSPLSVLQKRVTARRCVALCFEGRLWGAPAARNRVTLGTPPMHRRPPVDSAT
jgi:hypothetical protein